MSRSFAKRIGADLEAMLPGTDLLISAVPTSYLRTVWSAHAPLLDAALPILSVSKGLELGQLILVLVLMGAVFLRTRPSHFLGKGFMGFGHCFCPF